MHQKKKMLNCFRNNEIKMGIVVWYCRGKCVISFLWNTSFKNSLCFGPMDSTRYDIWERNLNVRVEGTGIFLLLKYAILLFLYLHSPLLQLPAMSVPGAFRVHGCKMNLVLIFSNACLWTKNIYIFFSLFKIALWYKFKEHWTWEELIQNYFFEVL